MPRQLHRDSSGRNALSLAILFAGVMGTAPLLVAQANAKADSALGSRERGSTLAAPVVAGTVAASANSLGGHVESAVPDDPPRSFRPLKLRRSVTATHGSGSDAWYLGMGGLALVLAICGGLVAAARRFLPQGEAGSLQIISRVSLSPKHSVYMLRAGRRVLLVGAGPQGAPALISELEDLPEDEPAGRQGGEP
jgi:flagellar biogenesis protein FliO